MKASHILLLSLILLAACSHDDLVTSREEAKLFTAMHAGAVEYAEAPLDEYLLDLVQDECPQANGSETIRATLKGAYGSLIYYISDDEIRCAILRPSPARTPRTLPQADAPEGVAMTINGRPITPEEVRVMMDALPAETPRDEATLGQVLTTLGDQELLREQAEGIEVPTELLATARAELLASQNTTEEQLAETLAQQGVTQEQFAELLEDDLRLSILLEQRLSLSDIDITRADAQEYYAQNPNLFLQGEVAVMRDIVLDTQGLTPAQLDARVQEMVALLRTEEFCTLVTERSADDTRRDQCGVYLIPRGTVDPRLEYASFSTPANQTSVVTLDGSVHFVQTMQIIPSQVTPFPQVEEGLVRDLRDAIVQQRLNTYLLFLRNSADIVIYT